MSGVRKKRHRKRIKRRWFERERDPKIDRCDLELLIDCPMPAIVNCKKRIVREMCASARLHMQKERIGVKKTIW